MLGVMKPTWLIAASSMMVVVQACGGQAFTVAGSGNAPEDASTVGPADATQERAYEAGADSGQSEASSVVDAAVDATGSGGGADAGSDGPLEVKDSARPTDAEWVPDVIEPPPALCSAGFACTPPVPSGWSGPMELFAGAAPAPPDCGANFEGPVYAGGTGATGDPAACGCTCGAPDNVLCSPIEMSFFSGFTCGAAAPCAQRTLTPGVCTSVDVTTECASMTASITMPATTATGGSCTAAPTKTVTPPSWGTQARACLSALGSAASNCVAGGVCAPLPSMPFAEVCIALAGIVACPTTGFTVRHTFYDAFDDARDCSMCSCGDVAGASCSADLSVFPTTGVAAACAKGADIYVAPSSCAPVQQPGDFRLDVTMPNAGSCAPTPVMPTGAVAPSQPTTFCCLP
jgi:hypothetical protein